MDCAALKALIHQCDNKKVAKRVYDERHEHFRAIAVCWICDVVKATKFGVDTRDTGNFINLKIFLI